MGYKIKITKPDGTSHTRKKVYKTKKGAQKKADFYEKLLTPEVRVVKCK